jgi:hypothetical protein
MNDSRYELATREDVDCLVTATCQNSQALTLIGETQGFDAVMNTLLVAGCMYINSRAGITPDDNTPVYEIARAARLLGLHLAINKAGEVVVVPTGTPGFRPVGVVERDAAYDQTEAGARVTDCASDPLRGAA